MWSSGISLYLQMAQGKPLSGGQVESWAMILSSHKVIPWGLGIRPGFQLTPTTKDLCDPGEVTSH